MNDYLDHLVARSLGLAEAVTPRPLSLFEPLPAIAGALTADDSSAEQLGAPQQLSVGLEPTIDGTAFSAPNAKLSETSPASRRAPQSSPQLQHPAQVIERSASQSTPRLIPHQPLMPAPVAGDPGKRPDRSEYSVPGRRQAVDSHPVASEHAPLRVVLRAKTPADGQSSTAQEATPLTPARAAATERAVTLPESTTPVPPSRTLLVVPVITPKPASDQERDGLFSGSAEPIPWATDTQRERTPTIKITIGRVDVRAVMPERPAPRPAPERRAALSLDEYLKQRSGGKP